VPRCSSAATSGSLLAALPLIVQLVASGRVEAFTVAVEG
jgi:hypothetical protein